MIEFQKKNKIKNIYKIIRGSNFKCGFNFRERMKFQMLITNVEDQISNAGSVSNKEKIFK